VVSRENAALTHDTYISIQPEESTPEPEISAWFIVVIYYPQTTALRSNSFSLSLICCEYITDKGVVYPLLPIRPNNRGEIITTGPGLS